MSFLKPKERDHATAIGVTTMSSPYHRRVVAAPPTHTMLDRNHAAEYSRYNIDEGLLGEGANLDNPRFSYSGQVSYTQEVRPIATTILPSRYYTLHR